MTIQAAQLDGFAVQREAGRGVPRLAEADASVILILRAVRVREVHDYVVQLRVLQTPQVDPGETVEMDIVILGLALELGAGRLQDLRSVEQFRRERRPARRSLQIAAHDDRAVLGQGPHCLGVHVLDERRWNDSQLDVAVDAAEGQVVDPVPERRNVGTLGRIQYHCDHVAAIVLQMLRQLEAERRVAALVLLELVPVDRNGGGSHGSAEIQEDSFSLPRGHGPEVAAVGGDELEVRLVEAVPGQAHVGVRQGDLLPRGIVEAGIRHARARLAAEQPVAIQFVQAAIGVRRLARALHLSR